MRNSANTLNLDASLKKLVTNKNKELAFSVQKVHAIDDASARIAIHIPQVHQKNISEDSLEVAIAKHFPKVRYLKNSVHRIKDDIYGVFVARNDRTMSMDIAAAEVASAKMTKINDTVYHDENDEIWTVHRDGEHSFLVSQIPDNISDLIGGLQVRRLATASAGLSMEEDFGAGRPVLYYDAARAEIAFGLAVDGSRVYNDKHKTIEAVESAHVLVVDDANTLQIETASSKEDLLSYMTMLYGHNQAFLSEIKEIINKYVEV